jgi:malonyl-CoA O-methyltransferase
MPDSSVKRLRHIDEVAVQRALRTLALQATAPWLHQEVARRMAERLAIIKLQPERVVDWWSYTGAGAGVLAAAYPQAQRMEVEPNASLLDRSEQAHVKPWWSLRRRPADRATVVRDSAFEASLAEPADLVWANMMLHAVADPPALMARWQKALGTDGFVMFSCLGPDTLRELSALYRRLAWPAPTMNFVDMHDLGDMLVGAGFADPVMDQETLKLSWADAPSLLAELKTLGGNASPDRCAGLRTPHWRARLEAELAALKGPDGRLYLSFEVAYGHAFKAAPKQPRAKQTEVSLDTMRTLIRAGAKPA